jgi:transcriptional regulator with PAS, ATPase and Fis domain
MIIGVSHALLGALELCDRFADTDVPVLLVGPTGVGKELLAGRIHARSGRRGALVPVNCAALPVDLAEAELFGARRGAYTGAHHDREGLISEAEGGTLFLDEVCSLPAGIQGKLLRFLQSGEMRRLGDRHYRKLDVRILAAANHLEAFEGESPALRIDLIHRLAGVVIGLPGLADRIEDVEPLARHFAGLEGCQLDQEAIAVLEAHSWPGSVRELRHVVRRAARFTEDGRICEEAVGSALRLGPASGLPEPEQTAPSHSALVRSERTQFLEVTRRIGSDSYALAEHLGISRATLFRRLKEWGLSLKDVRRARELTP